MSDSEIPSTMDSINLKKTFVNFINARKPKSTITGRCDRERLLIFEISK